LLNAIFIKINPHGKEFAMTLPRLHSIGNVSAWGHHFHMPPRSQNGEFSTPGGKNYSTATKKIISKMLKLLLSSAEVTSHNE
jgi:hypothetical protein